jgi:energy-coupling factor transporter ATP-binding protein EcfA2
MHKHVGCNKPKKMITTKETLTLINSFKNPLLELASDLKDEVKFYFDTGIIKYVENNRKKFIKTKTFLYRHENINFYDIYFPITLRFKNEHKYNLNDVNDLFNESNFIAVIGNAGSGKSMLLKHLFLLSIKQFVKIPIVIELRNLNDYQGTFFEYVNKSLSGQKITPNAKILERILTDGEFIFLLDGYDEIYSDNKNKITTELIEFMDIYSNNFFFITSRPGANIESLPRFNSYFVNNLDNIQVKEFIKLQLKLCDDNKLGEKIISVVDKPENKDYNSYLSSPLLLSMFIMTFNSYPELPKSKSKFYWNVFDTLCTKHDSFTKQGGYQHERKTGLQNEEFEHILKWFSYISLFKGKYSFDNQYFTNLLQKIKGKLKLDCSLTDLKEDLTVAISIIMIDGLEYKFPHKSLQEYFSALLIKEQLEPIKQNIYSEKLPVLSHHTFGNNENFWNLCSEMDTNSFNKYFTLKFLNDYLSSLDLTSEKTTCKSFFKWGGIKHGISCSSDKNTYRFTSMESLISTTANVLEFSNIISLNLGTNFNGTMPKNIVDKLFKLNLIDIIQENKNKKLVIDYYGKWNDALFEFITENGIKDKILNSVKLTKEKIAEIESEIDFFEKSNIELLEL